MIKSLIWDFDGTLFNTYPSMLAAFKMALKDYEIEEEEYNIIQHMKISASKAMNHYAKKYNLPEDFSKRYVSYEKATKPEGSVPFPHAHDVCDKFMKKGGRNFIVTHRDNSTYKYLKNYSMENLFTEIVTKHNGFKRKPDPEGFLYIVNKYGLKKEETLIVGDRDFEIIGAKDAGIKVCLYNTNNITITVQPDYEVQSLKELENIIY